jgi:hypothetical protein
VKIVSSRVRCCVEESHIMDKKMRKRTFKYKKFMIPLSEDQPIQEDEEIKIMSEEDFILIQQICKELRDDKNNLLKQVDNLNSILEEKDNHIAVLEGKTGLTKTGRFAGWIKTLMTK